MGCVYDVVLDDSDGAEVAGDIDDIVGFIVPLEGDWGSKVMVGKGSERAKDVRIALADEPEKEMVEAKSTVEGTRLEVGSMTEGETEAM